MYDIGKFKPCDEGLEWYNTQPDEKTAWENCIRGDWMLWIAQKLKISDRILTLTKGHCANTVRHLMEDKRSKAAVDAAIKYGKEKITREELNAYADAAAFAYAAAYAYADADAAAFAAYAAYAAAAAYAGAAAYAAYAAAEKTRKKTADICRKYLTKAIFQKVKVKNPHSDLSGKG